MALKLYNMFTAIEDKRGHILQNGKTRNFSDLRGLSNEDLIRFISESAILDVQNREIIKESFELKLKCPEATDIGQIYTHRAFSDFYSFIREQMPILEDRLTQHYEDTKSKKHFIKRLTMKFGRFNYINSKLNESDTPTYKDYIDVATNYALTAATTKELDMHMYDETALKDLVEDFPFITLSLRRQIDSIEHISRNMACNIFPLVTLEIDQRPKIDGLRTGYAHAYIHDGQHVRNQNTSCDETRIALLSFARKIVFREKFEEFLSNSSYEDAKRKEAIFFEFTHENSSGLYRVFDHNNEKRDIKSTLREQHSHFFQVKEPENSYHRYILGSIQENTNLADTNEKNYEKIAVSMGELFEFIEDCVTENNKLGEFDCSWWFGMRF